MPYVLPRVATTRMQMNKLATSEEAIREYIFSHLSYMVVRDRKIMSLRTSPVARNIKIASHLCAARRISLLLELLISVSRSCSNEQSKSLMHHKAMKRRHFRKRNAERLELFREPKPIIATTTSSMKRHHGASETRQAQMDAVLQELERDSSLPSTNLYLEGLDESVTEEQLAEIFCVYGSWFH